MKENKYDDERFFGQYSQMSRSVQGLRGAGEWHELKKMLPDFNGKRVLDLGCGFGWHCRYAIERGATFALGIDLSGKMLDKAREINPSPLIEYKRIAIEDFDFAPNSFDIVISSLTFHYLESFDTVCTEVYKCLTQEGVFVFSVEHPVFTAYGNQDWIYDSEGKPAHWPVDHYFQEGIRHARFLGEDGGEARPVRKKFVDAPVRKPIKPKGERPVKMRYRDEDDRKKGFGDHKRDGKRPFSKPIKPIKRRGYDDYED